MTDSRDIISKTRVERRATFPGICRICKGKVYVGDAIFWFPKTNKVEHYNCTRNKLKT